MDRNYQQKYRKNMIKILYKKIPLPIRSILSMTWHKTVYYVRKTVGSFVLIKIYYKIKRNFYPINSEKYWNYRFKSQDWQKSGGDEQTLHFYVLLINTIPSNILEELESKKQTIIDFGCAQGEGTSFFAQMLPRTIVTGVDFSKYSIDIATKKHNNSSFLCTDLTKNQYKGNKWDTLISSNTLEHFHEPWEVLYILSSYVRNYLIILVPFEQILIEVDEHFYSFNYDNIPQNISNFELSFSKIVYPNPKYWGEKQILLIYKNNSKAK